MREVHFHKQNIDKWRDFERQINSRTSQSPDMLADLFIKVTDDLSYARTYYPNSNTTRYLNGLATTVHQRIYKNKREKSGRFIRFWTHDIPLAVYQIRKPIFYSLIIFAISILIAIVSESKDRHFTTMILGENYIETTRENVSKGDPLGIYNSGGELYSFIWIAVNNIKIDFFTFAFGFFFGIGTAYIIFQNGIMLGAFEYMLTYEMNISFHDALPVWVHGTFEMSAMVIAGGAGIALGSSILFPKTFSRKLSIQKASFNGMTVFVSILPLTLIAAVLEGFVTRDFVIHGSALPMVFCWLIILTSLAFIIFYYIIYPVKIHKQNAEQRLTGLTQIQGLDPVIA